MRKSEEVQGAAILQWGKAILLGSVIAFGVCLIFLFFSALCISQGILSAGLQYQLAVVGCVLGSFIGGIFAVRKCNAQSLVVGLAVGGASFLLQLTIGLLMYDTLTLENGGIGLLCAVLCGGAAAGILGKGKKKTASRKKNRRGR